MVEWQAGLRQSSNFELLVDIFLSSSHRDITCASCFLSTWREAAPANNKRDGRDEQARSICRDRWCQQLCVRMMSNWRNTQHKEDATRRVIKGMGGTPKTQDDSDLCFLSIFAIPCYSLPILDWCGFWSILDSFLLFNVHSDTITVIQEFTILSLFAALHCDHLFTWADSFSSSNCASWCCSNGVLYFCWLLLYFFLSEYCVSLFLTSSFTRCHLLLPRYQHGLTLRLLGLVDV